MRSPLLVVVVVVVSGTGVADACQCDSRPDLVVSPPSDSVVPAHPTFYVFAPTIDGSTGTFVDAFAIKNVETVAPIDTIRTKIVDINPEYVVYEIASEAREGAIELDVTYDHTEKVARYTISDTPIDDRARIVGLDHGSLYACGNDVGDRIWLESDGDAVALRFAWDDGTSTITPIDELFLGARASNAMPPHRARVGMFCGHTNVSGTQLAKRRGFGLYALFADGTSRRLGASDARVPDVAAALPCLMFSERATIDRSATIAIGVTTGGLAGLACVLAMRLAARRRRHRPRYSAG